MLVATIHGSRGSPTPHTELLAHGHEVVFEVDHRPQPLLFPTTCPRDQTGLFPPHEGRSRPRSLN